MSHSEDCRTLGQHVGTRLVEAGVTKFFGVPGDYNLQLLDELVKEAKLEAVWCSNELNAGYAADGYARVKGVGCVVVTYNVGGLSAINAVAGAYAENLPVICITGGPNSNDAGNVDYGTGRIVHHTIADPDGFMQEVECYKHVTCEQVVISNLDNAHELIDRAISAALVNSKPVYISIACNLAGLGHSSFVRPPIPYSLARKPSNPQSLAAAVDAALAFLGGKKKPVVVAGALLRMSHAQKQFMHFVEASGYPYAPMPAAKGFVPEGHPQYMGTYWGQVSSPSVGEVVESADAYLFAGPVFSDYSTVGYSLNLSPAKMVKVDPYRVTVAGGKGGQVYGCVRMDDFLEALAVKVQRNGTAMEIFSRLHQPPAEIPASADGSPLETKVLFKHVQGLLDSNSIVLAETGDSIFNCQKLRLPEGATYEWAQQYGSIGWSVGATLGAAVAAGAVGRRVVACIGDGSFQMTAQAVSDMLRARANPVIMLINNAGYTIEVEIHDGPYNVIKNWDYVKFVEAVHNGDGELFACRVRTEAELVDALAKVKGEAAQKLCFIECIIDKDDCSKELLEFGALVSAHNSKPPVYN